MHLTRALGNPVAAAVTVAAPALCGAVPFDRIHCAQQEERGDRAAFLPIIKKGE